MPAQPSLDFDAIPLAGLAEALPRDEFQSLLEDYIQDAADRLDRLEALAAAGDLAALGREAHTLISTTGSYGLSRASAIARAVVSACKCSDVEAAAALAHDLVLAAAAGCTAMRHRFLPATA